VPRPGVKTKERRIMDLVPGAVNGLNSDLNLTAQKL
jgi:hypothetical protein